MKTVRIVINLVLAAALSALGVYLLAQDSVFVPDRWNPAVGTLFRGPSLYWLATAVFTMAAFAGAVARDWLTGTVAPPTGPWRPHPAYKGALIVRYWYLIVMMLVAVVTAFALAQKVASPVLAAL